jgi:hypothetical protein
LVYRIAFILALLASTMATAKKAPEPKQFLDRSVVTFAKSIGDYTLTDTQYDPEQWAYGVTSLWTFDDAPEGLRLNVFVYPLGRAEESDVLAGQMADVENGLRDAVKQGFYADLVVGDRESFAVIAAESTLLDEKKGKGRRKRDQAKRNEPLAIMPKPEHRLEATNDADPLAAALAASMPAANSYGLRQSFSFRHDGVPVRSRGYVFYRHLFGFKVRITAPVGAMDEAAFETLADNATRTLVPRIEVKNFGQCGILTVSGTDRDADDESDSNLAAQQILLGIARIRAENCAAAEGKKSAAARHRGTQIEIVYPADTWKVGE